MTVFNVLVSKVGNFNMFIMYFFCYILRRLVKQYQFKKKEEADLP